jgi:hypothetical protein
MTLVGMLVLIKQAVRVASFSTGTQRRMVTHSSSLGNLEASIKNLEKGGAQAQLNQVLAQTQNMAQGHLTHKRILGLGVTN